MGVGPGVIVSVAVKVGVRDGVAEGVAEGVGLGVTLGGRPETFMGLAGAGDLILTCTGDLSRNRRVGLKLAQGEPLPSILAELGHVAEGVSTARELGRVAGELGIEMPVTQAVCRVLADHTQARAAAHELLQREPKAEH